MQLSFLISPLLSTLQMISHNIDAIKLKIAMTAQRCGRAKDSVKLVAVSKRFPSSAIKEALTAGQFHFGENYIQEAQEKYQKLGKDIHLHFIGHLQSNKAKIAAQIFSMVETVDSIKIATVLNKHLEKLDKNLDILIQVNIGCDENKSGIAPENTRDLLVEISNLPKLNPLGLMTITPFSKSPEHSRPFFRDLRILSEKLKKDQLFYDNNQVDLSMGMSNDYHIAIEEGSTLVRLGTAVFGQRSPKY